ncbi:MAG TPA: HpcH/HpaI aldolase/citrate lyase family protein [Salinisphaeraceae bacterium]|nr:HpcH/HpaI aldolase/citrate lyase family protein [Salinisphaeraceae bacterium]
MPLHLKPTLRDVLQQAERTLFGGWACTGSAVTAEIMAGSSLDCLLIDMEHGPNGLPSVLAQLQAVAAYPITPIVRVPAGETTIIKQVLDLGAQNLLVPMVSTPDQAQAVARAVQYPPNGVRGVGSALARSARWNRVPDYLVEAARHVSVFVQVETGEGVENAAAIAATEGIDGVFVGPSDLAASMGHLGQQEHPEVVAAVKRTFARVREAGRFVAVNAFNPERADEYAAAGASFVLVGADVTLMARGSEALAQRFVNTR